MLNESRKRQQQQQKIHKRINSQCLRYLYYLIRSPLVSTEQIRVTEEDCEPDWPSGKALGW